jgi:hypothetical protein
MLPLPYPSITQDHATHEESATTTRKASMTTPIKKPEDSKVLKTEPLVSLCSNIHVRQVLISV